MHAFRPSLLALAVVAGCGSPARTPSTSPTSGAAPATPAAPAVAPAAPEPLELCDAVQRIVDAGASNYYFVAVEGAWISDDPSMFHSKVLVPGSRECTIGVDEDTETGELWCLMEVDGTTDDRIARFDQLRTALLPCFPSDTWRSAAADRVLPGWAFAPTESGLPSAELRLADINGVVTLIFRVVSQPGAGKRE